MARIRSVKPEYFTHPEVLNLSIPARLLFISLWGQADDEGRLYDQPLKIGGQAFGENDKVNVRVLLSELAVNARILRYRSEDRDCIQVRNWKHQAINRRKASVIPAPDVTDDAVMRSGWLPDESYQEQGTGNGTGNREQGSVEQPLMFDAFWQAYPRKVAKLDAVKAWNVALDEKADPAEIVAAAKVYGASRSGQDETYTKHPGPWLRAGRWMDETTPDDGLTPEGRRALELLKGDYA